MIMACLVLFLIHDAETFTQPLALCRTRTCFRHYSAKTNATHTPQRTENGGYAHTVESRSKISAANKGKTPWNKGKARSEEVRAKIAAGVRAKNRERFLKKLEDMGLTEEEYEAQEKERKATVRRELSARKTDNGGYRPTEETKQKISKVLKDKYASGEIVWKRTVDPAKVRRGYTHSEETRAKISASLKKRWQDDDYRNNMAEKTKNSCSEVRQKISNTLRAKWQDPAFRASMINSFQNRDKRSPYGLSHGEKISIAVKKKWQDEDYRRKTLEGIQRSLATRPRAPPRPKPEKKSRAKPKPVPKVVPTRAPVMKRTVKGSQNGDSSQNEDVEVSLAKRVVTRKKKKKKKKRVSVEAKAKKAAVEDGDVTQLRENRRDLYDLLYGDTKALSLGDENLEEFDPYGLEDF